MPDRDDPYSGYNAMQTHMGVMPQSPVMPPGAAAQMMVSRADHQRAYAMSAGLPSHWQGSGAGAASMVGEQFRQRFEHIQSQQSFNPYMAHAMAQGPTPGFMPSPLMMTPPSTGVFSARPEGPRFMPLPPQPMMPMFSTPFTPQLPPPMFQSAEDREYRMQDMQQDRFFSRAVQAPRLFGAGLGMGASAFIGGAAGGPIGAIAGGALGHASGFAGGVGNLMMRPFQPMIEQRQMGAAIRDFSQDWVTTGPDRHRAGTGFSREASLRLAESIQELSRDRAFQRETGGMFNQGDLVSITRQAGRVGLMDESQDIEGVRKNIKNVSRTLKKYMQLTQDPDMVNVLRELGQMKQFGMTLEDMELAASSMSRYSKAAGMSIAGIKQMGLYGGATFQQAGLTAGSGITYGMHAAASARQAVATGTFEPRELALMGGVQGLAQRNIQAQAAMFSMPMFGAAVAGYGPGGFNLDQGNLQGLMGGGAMGMVNQAVANMGSAVSQGGVGALASFPLQQRRLQTMAAERLSPEQAMAMRFQTALQTGQQLGLQGAHAFDAGARLMYGDEIAEQMSYEAQNPEFFREQRRSIQDRRQRLVRESREQAEAARTSGLERAWQRSPYPGIGRAVAAPAGFAARAASDIMEPFRGIGRQIGDIQAEAEGRYVQRTDPRFTFRSTEERRRAFAMDRGVLRAAAGSEAEAGPAQFSARTVAQAASAAGLLPTDDVAMAGGVALNVLDPVGWGLRKALGVDALPAAGMEAAMGATVTHALGSDRTAALVVEQAKKAHALSSMVEWGLSTGRTDEGYSAAVDVLKRSAKGKDSGTILRRAGDHIAALLKAKQPIILPDGTVDKKAVEQSLLLGMRSVGMSPRDIREALPELLAGDGLKVVGGRALAEAMVGNPDLEAHLQEGAAKSQLLWRRTIDERLGGGLEATKARLKELESEMDFTSMPLTPIGLFLGRTDRAGAEGAREVLAQGPGVALASVVASLKGEEASQAQEAAFEQYARIHAGSDKTREELQEEFSKLVGKQRGAVAALPRDVQKRLAGVAKRADYATIAQYGATAIMGKLQAGLGEGISTLAGAVGDRGAGELIGLVGTKGTGMTGTDIAQAVGAGGIKSLHVAGHRDIATKLAKLSSSDLSEEERQRLEQEVMGDIAGLGEAAERTETELGVAAGPEAAKLDEADKSLAAVQSEMSAAFRTFRPAAAQFADGAAKLVQAMNSDLYKKMVDG